MATNDEVRSMAFWQEVARQDELAYERSLREREQAEQIRIYHSDVLGAVTIPEGD
jgi:hypothetical protein